MDAHGFSSQQALTEALLAIGRLDGVLENHPLRQAWLHRSRLQATVQAMAWNGRGVDPQRLAAVRAGVQLPATDDRRSESQALALLDFLHGIETVDDPAVDGFRDDAALMEDAIEDSISSGQAVLQSIADVAGRMRSELDTRPGALVVAVPVILHRHGLTRSGMIDGLAAWPPPGRNWTAAFYDGLARNAKDGLNRLHALTHTSVAWKRLLGERRSNSRLPALVVAALCHASLTPSSAAKLLDITVAGAGKLLTEMEGLGILSEVSGRTGCYRIYVPSEQAEFKVRRSDKKRSAEPPKDFGGQHLDSLMAEMDAVLARVGSRLSRDFRG